MSADIIKQIDEALRLAEHIDEQTLLADCRAALVAEREAAQAAIDELQAERARADSAEADALLLEGDYETRLAVAQREAAALRAALKAVVNQFVGVDHHRDECPGQLAHDGVTVLGPVCLEHQIDEQADAALASTTAGEGWVSPEEHAAVKAERDQALRSRTALTGALEKCEQERDQALAELAAHNEQFEALMRKAWWKGQSWNSGRGGNEAKPVQDADIAELLRGGGQ